MSDRPEICVCAAIRSPGGRLFRGQRHNDAMQAAGNSGWSREDVIYAGQGFITSRNRYVTREEGMALQLAAGIESASKDGYHGDILFSEDLY